MGRSKYQTSEGKQKLEILQAVKGIAALGIVYFHTEYGPWKSANWGVDFFFILSGFLIMLSTNAQNVKMKEQHAKQIPSDEKKLQNLQSRFWMSRITKICPLYYAMTLAVIVIYQIAPNVFRSTIVTVETIIKSFLFIPCYAAEGRIFPIYSIAWTVNLEMLFYVIFSICMLINYKKRGELAICVLTALAIFGKIITTGNAILLFWTNKRLIDFAIGIAAYLVYEKGAFINLKNTSTMSILFMVVEIVMLFSGAYILGERFTVAWNMIWAGLLLVTCLVYGKAKCNRCLVMLGDISYSMYMIHFLPIGFAVRVLIDNNVYSIRNTIVVVLAVVVVIPVSYVVYRIMEVWVPSKIKGILGKVRIA